MGKYINWDDVVDRYRSMSDLGDAEEMQDVYVQYAEAYVEANLALKYTVPFSTNNATARDLSIDAAYLRAIRFKDQDKATQVEEYLKGQFEMLLNNTMTMMTDSGAAIGTVTANEIYNSTENYVPIFGFSPDHYQEVDPQITIDEENDRGY